MYRTRELTKYKNALYPRNVQTNDVYLYFQRSSRIKEFTILTDFVKKITNIEILRTLVEVEFVEGDTNETATIEELDENDPTVDFIESDTIKKEPKNPVGPDGIDHSALEGMVNMCASQPEEPAEEPITEDKIKEKWTDEMIQEEIEKGTTGFQDK